MIYYILLTPFLVDLWSLMTTKQPTLMIKPRYEIHHINIKITTSSPCKFYES